MFLSVDCGTTIIKASLIDDGFRLVDEEKRSVTVYTPSPGYSEADMDAIWRALCEIAQALKSRNGAIWSSIECVGIAGQGDGLWPVDKSGRPVCRALLWNDTRSKDMNFDELPDVTRLVDEQRTNQVFAGSNGALLAWLKAHRVEDYRRVYKALHCKDWLNYKLTGVLCTDRSDASTALYNHQTGEYVPELLEALGIPEAMDMLPELVDSTQIIGGVTQEASFRTGLPVGTPVIEGCVDVAAVALGSDVSQQGRACTIIGTTLCSEIALYKEDINFDEKSGLLVHHCVPHLYLRLMPTLSGASTTDYIKKLLFPNETFPQIEKRIEELPIGCNGLIYHPYICGERAPFKNPFATAGFFGLTATHTTLDMMRAAFEGLAYSCYDCFRLLDKKYDILYLSGGAARSATVCRMFADVLGSRCHRVEVKELGVLGVTRLMQVACGRAKSVADFADQSVTVFEPDMARHERYMEGYALFKDLQQSMERFWQESTKLV